MGKVERRTLDCQDQGQENWGDSPCVALGYTSRLRNLVIATRGGPRPPPPDPHPFNHLSNPPLPTPIRCPVQWAGPQGRLPQLTLSLDSCKIGRSSTQFAKYQRMFVWADWDILHRIVRDLKLATGHNFRGHPLTLPLPPPLPRSALKNLASRTLS